MQVRFACRALALAGLVSLIGCGSVVEPSKNQVETFSGTLEPQKSVTRTTNINNSGEYSVKLTQLSPSTTAVVGLRLDFGPNCELFVQANLAQLNTPALAGPIFQKGQYCLTIYDVGSLTTAQSYTVTFSHP
jgi:hypothetical protein